MNSQTIKAEIIHYLEDKDWIFGGVLGRSIHEITGSKESIIERRARELAEDGKILKDYEQIEGRGPRCVKYRIALKPAQINEFAIGKVSFLTSARQAVPVRGGFIQEIRRVVENKPLHFQDTLLQ